MTDYVWKRDIPVFLAKNESASTIFKLTFWTSFYVLSKRLEKYDEIWYN